MTMTLVPSVELYGAMRRLPVEIVVHEKSHQIPINRRLRIGGFGLNFLEHFVGDEIVPAGSLAVTELRELASDAGIKSLFGFVGERLEITIGQFIEGCVGATTLWHSDSHQFSNRRPGISYIGYVRLHGELWVVSGHVFRGEWHFDADAPDDMCTDWLSGTRIFSNAPLPIQEPVLPPIFRSHTSIRF